MKKMKHVQIVFLLLFPVIFSCTSFSPKKPLFNGKNLDNWEIFLGSSLGKEFDSISSVATPEKVFSVVTVNGEQMIRISGEINGSLATKESYNDYHLRLVFRWGDKVYSRRNSGLLYHSFGEFGAAFGTWMANIEHQLMHDNLGDTYLMANTVCETTVEKAENNDFVYTPNGEPLEFGVLANGRMIRKAVDAEKPLGEWNTVDLYCLGTTAVHIVNGKVVMVNKGTGIVVNEEKIPLSKGKIQIQSEGAELFIKLIEIEPIKKLPEF
jgi:hypothetical protein